MLRLISINAMMVPQTYVETTGSEVGAMITLEDCIALCGLTEEEVLALAEHEHIPEIAAAALGQYLLNQPHGAETIRDMIREDIRTAWQQGNRQHAHELFMALRHFLSEHPEAGTVASTDDAA